MEQPVTFRVANRAFKVTLHEGDIQFEGEGFNEFDGTIHKSRALLAAIAATSPSPSPSQTPTK